MPLPLAPTAADPRYASFRSEYDLTVTGPVDHSTEPAYDSWLNSLGNLRPDCGQQQELVIANFQLAWLPRAGYTTFTFRLTPEALESVITAAPEHLALTVEVTQMATDGLRVVHTYPPNEAGYCPSTCWVPDLDDALRQGMRLLSALTGTSECWQPDHPDPYVPADQRAYVLGNIDMDDHGFRVTCTEDGGHDGDCRAGQWPWSWNAATGVVLP